MCLSSPSRNDPCSKKSSQAWSQCPKTASFLNSATLSCTTKQSGGIAIARHFAPHSTALPPFPFSRQATAFAKALIFIRRDSKKHVQVLLAWATRYQIGVWSGACRYVLIAAIDKGSVSKASSIWVYFLPLPTRPKNNHHVFQVEVFNWAVGAAGGSVMFSLAWASAGVCLASASPLPRLCLAVPPGLICLFLSAESSCPGRRLGAESRSILRSSGSGQVLQEGVRFVASLV